jgi:ribosome biogenesis SPOUT family RNA methylase Rps3
MKSKTTFIITIASFLIISCTNNTPKTSADSTVKEVSSEMADMKSYVIQYKNEVKASGAKSSAIITQYIDMKNDKMSIETESYTELNNSKISEKSLAIYDKEWTYIINLKDKTGVKMKEDQAEDDPMDMIKSDDNITFRQMIEKEGGKIIGNEQFLGKDCIVVEMKQEGQISKMFYYKGIPLKIESPAYTMEAIKFEENITIPVSKFTIPTGITLSEVPVMP